MTETTHATPGATDAEAEATEGRVEGGEALALRTLEREGIDALVAIGGEDTLGVANKLGELGVPVVGIPKTIDNDLSATEVTFGFDTAVATATEAIDRLRTTAESHHRVIVCEVMGRHAGWIAAYAGIAGGAAEILVPGRLQVIDQDPLTLLDGAHNPDGIAALAEALAEPWAAGHERVVAVVSVLDDKDAAAMLAGLLPMCDALVLTASQNPRALPPPTLQSLAGQLGGPPSEVIRDPRVALSRAREIAGPGGLVVATGSIYLVADLLRPAGAGRASML